MKAHFLRLFQYDHQASLILLETIGKAGYPKRAIDLMGHLLAAKQIWLSRCREDRPAVHPLWPEQPAEQIRTGLENVQAGWLSFLHALQPDEFNRITRYQTSSGQTFENLLMDILTHVVNHGTHHRAQAGEYLRATGFEGLPPTDYILYIRETGKG